MKLNGNHKIEQKVSLRLEKPEARVWKELQAFHKEFQSILSLLIRYDEGEGKEERNWLLHMRRAICAIEHRSLKFFLCHLGGHLFHVIAEAEGLGGYLVTSWLHEDGIQAEREENISNPSHPVHNLLCLTDFYYGNSVEVDLERDKKKLGEAVLALMQEDG